MAFGEEVFEEPERTRFYKQVNYQTVYSNTDVSEYNLTAYITKLEDQTRYVYPFERIKHLLGEDAMNPETKKEDKKMEDIKEEDEDEETKVEEITDEQAEQIEKKNKGKEGSNPDSKDEPEEENMFEDLGNMLDRKEKDIDLNDI